MADRVGQQLGNYRLVALLGQGGYAEVYLGQHVRLNLQAAIKVLHTHLTDQEASHFQQEAETIATLMHPSIVRLLDFDVQEGVPFLIMDYAPNGSLRRRYPKGTMVPLPHIVSSLKQVAAALQYAHEHKFIHCDVKPENMLLGRQQEVLLSDFGLAALAHSSASLSMQEAVGTLPYMAPEQIEGHPRAASDQYALGVVVYEWLCGSRPFEGSATVVIVQQLTMSPPALHERVPTIPLGVEQVVLRALAKDPKDRFGSVHDFATAFEQASLLAPAYEMPPLGEQAASVPTEATSYATVATPSDGQVGALPEGAASADASPPAIGTPPSQSDDLTPEADQLAPLRATLAPSPAVGLATVQPTLPLRQRIRRLSGMSAALLVGLVVVVIAGGILGSLSLLTHFGVLGAHSGPPVIQVARGGTWTYGVAGDAGSLIPGSPGGESTPIMDALYLPLFYDDAQGMIQAGAASEVPSIHNGGVNTDATTWTFHMRPGLVWSDGQPYDARDVDFTWKLWLNPKFGDTNNLVQNGSLLGLNLISSTEVSADHLAITFHLKHPFAPFLADVWVGGTLAPMPAHEFSSMAPEKILSSPENLNPKVVSGPFMMSESVPGDHYTVVRNPNYYLASRGLPYLDKIVFSIVESYAQSLKEEQEGLLDGGPTIFDVQNFQTLQRFKDLTPISPPTQGYFEALFFDFHNRVLASHLEVRQAMAMAVDQPTIIAGALKGLGTPLCTDHPSAYHPGYEPFPPCPVFSLAAANQLLDDNGWVRGPDGVRTKGGQRLEFEYSTQVQYNPERIAVQTIIQRDFQQIGIKLDIQNYANSTFSNFLPQGQASPPTGAVAGRYDIAELSGNFGYDPDDSSQGAGACDQFPPNGYNIAFYCNHALDGLYAQEQATADPGVRQQVFDQIHAIYLTQFPFITLYSPIYFALEKKGNHDFLPGPFGDTTYNISQWWCDNAKC